MIISEAFPKLRVGQIIKTNGAFNEAEKWFVGEIGEIDLNIAYIWQDLKNGTVGKMLPSTKGYKYSWRICGNNSLGEIEILKDIKGENMMETIKKYFIKHQDALITLGIIIVIDNFLFNGAFREKIKTSIEKMLGKAEEKLSK